MHILKAARAGAMALACALLVGVGAAAAADHSLTAKDASLATRYICGKDTGQGADTHANASCFVGWDIAGVTMFTLAKDASVTTTNTDLGAPGATACASDTASCSLNQLLQRIAQRLTTLDGEYAALATAAKQPALGTAGAASSNVITVQGIASMTPFSVAPGADELHHGEVGGHSFVVGATFTTPAGTTAYSDLDLVANSGTAGSVVPLDFATVCRVNAGTFHIWRARVKTADSGMAGKSIWLKLYRDSPTVANGDNAAFSSTESNYIGQIPVTFDQHFSDPFEKGIGAPTVGASITGDCAASSQHIYGLIQSNGGSATLLGAKAWTAVLEGDDN